MFSQYPREDYSDKKAGPRGLLDILQRAGVQVLWLENNSDCRAPACGCPGTSEDQPSPFCDGKNCLDESLL